jgi:hypothetical protein
MAVVAILLESIVSEDCTATELLMAIVDPGVDDVNPNASAGIQVAISPTEREEPLVDAVEADRGTWLHNLITEADLLVLLHVLDRGILTQCSNR